MSTFFYIQISYVNSPVWNRGEANQNNSKTSSTVYTFSVEDQARLKNKTGLPATTSAEREQHSKEFSNSVTSDWIIIINKSSFPFSIMSYESMEDLVQGNALRIGRVAIALRREVKEVARNIWQAMEGRPGDACGRHRAQRMEAAMERLEL